MNPKYRSLTTIFVNLLGSLISLPSAERSTSWEIGLDTGVVSSKPASYKISFAYFVCEIKMPSVVLVSSTPRRQLASPRSFIVKRECRNDFIVPISTSD